MRINPIFPQIPIKNKSIYYIIDNKKACMAIFDGVCDGVHISNKFGHV